MKMLPHKKDAHALTEQELLRKLEKQIQKLSLKNDFLILLMIGGWVIGALFMGLIIDVSDALIGIDGRIQLISENIDCLSKGLNLVLKPLDMLQMTLLCF